MNLSAHTIWCANDWVVEPENGRFAVRYRTHEGMRLGADGSLQVGQPEPYWFNTREWAELCVRRLRSLDVAFGRSGPFLNTAGSLMIGSNFNGRQQFEFRVGPKALVTIDQGGAVTRFDLPALVGIWWRSTAAYRAWRVLLWGEKA